MSDVIINSNNGLIPHDSDFFKPSTDFDRQHARQLARAAARSCCDHGERRQESDDIGEGFMVRPKRDWGRPHRRGVR